MNMNPKDLIKNQEENETEKEAKESETEEEDQQEGKKILGKEEKNLFLPKRPKLPFWMRRELPLGKIAPMIELLQKEKIPTVCEEALCPNRLHCYSKKRATFLALGKFCTRKCRFCHIAHKKNPPPPDPREIDKIAFVAKKLALEHVVITMVSRDDLEDEGALHIAKILYTLRKKMPKSTLEVLVSDFSGKKELIDIVLDAKPDIFNHNLETVRLLTPLVRYRARYDRSLEVLDYAKKSQKVSFTKSGLMVGFGESFENVKEAIKDLHSAGCDIITIGQYLQPDKTCLQVESFISPDIFEEFSSYGKSLGVKKMICGPYVRSSYFAEAHF
jgi:lipoyl synthase